MALNNAGEPTPPERFPNPVALGSLIVAIAALAWQVYRDIKNQNEKPTRDTLARRIRVERRTYTDLTAAEEKVIEILSAEVIQRADEADDR